jgi:hypothetical protein
MLEVARVPSYWTPYSIYLGSWEETARFLEQ